MNEIEMMTSEEIDEEIRTLSSNLVEISDIHFTDYSKKMGY